MSAEGAPRFEPLGTNHAEVIFPPTALRPEGQRKVMRVETTYSDDEVASGRERRSLRNEIAGRILAMDSDQLRALKEQIDEMDLRD